MKSIDFDYELVNLEDIPSGTGSKLGIVWKNRLLSLPTDKIAKLEFNNRQRAHQIRCLIRSSGRYHHIGIGTRIIHASPEIHDTDKWLLYFWRTSKEEGK